MKGAGGGGGPREVEILVKPDDYRVDSAMRSNSITGVKGNRTPLFDRLNYSASSAYEHPFARFN